MTSYNVVNGVPASEQHALITDVLRGEWGFDGLVMSDWGAVCDRAAGVRAGMDLEMPGTQGFHDKAVLDAVAGGHLSPDDVAACAQRVLDLVARSSRATPTELSPAEVDAHDALARRAAAESAVLLSNDGVLPISRSATVALIGGFATEPRYQGSGSSRVNPRRVTSALEALRGRGMDVSTASGTVLEEAVRTAKAAEVAVVMVGLPDTYESEGFDRDDLHLPPEHDALVAAVCAANPRTVVVLSNGAPVALPWRDEPAAILECYLGGQASGAALADVLLGDVEPGGRLAETFPVRREDLTADAWFPGEPHQVQHREGPLVGYRDLTTRGVAAAFPFGHGLGYSTFAWRDASLDRTELDAAGLEPEIGVVAVRVSLVVTNPGERAGSDVVQVYLHDRTGVVARPRRTLAGFAKVRLDAGAVHQVTVDVPLRALAFWDVDEAGWRIPAGAFDVEVARSSEDVVETLPLTVEGGVTTAPAGARGPLGDTSDAAFELALGHPVPEARPTTPYSRRSTLEEISATLAGRAFRRLVWRAAPIDETTRADAAAMAMYERSIDELPLYGAANFGDGLLRPAVIDALVDLMNGPPVRGVSRAVLGLTRSGVGWAVGVCSRLVRR